MDKIKALFAVKKNQYITLAVALFLVITQFFVRDVFIVNLPLFILSVTFGILTMIIRKEISCSILRNLFMAFSFLLIAVVPLESAIRIGSFFELVVDIIFTIAALIFFIKAIFPKTK